MTKLTQDTRAVRAGLESCDVTGAVVPPLHLSSTYAFRGFGDKRKYDYSRSGNPTRDLLAEALADLEGGAGAVITASGMGAITLVGHLLPVGARIVAPHDCYGGTFRLFTAWNKRGELKVEFVDLRRRRGGATRRCRSPRHWCGSRRPAIRCCASPTSPTSRAARMPSARWWWPTTPSCRPAGSGRWRSAPTSSCTRPRSTSTATATSSAARSSRRPRSWPSRSAGGATASGSRARAFDSYLTLRGLRTLHVRLREHGRNAQAIAEFLAEQKRREAACTIPGLPSHPGHEIAKRQQSGFGAIVTLEVAGGVDGAQALLRGARVVLAGRVAGRRREPGGASGHDDACGHGARSARRGGTGRWVAAPVDRHRVDRRPAARPAPTASSRWAEFTRRNCRACSCQPD